MKKGVGLLLLASFFVSCSGPEYLLSAGPRPFLGNEKSAIIIQEFSDFECPACRQSFPLVKQIIEKYQNKIRFEYHHLPLTQIHKYALDAAIATECANDQGKFWEYHDTLFSNDKLTKEDLKKYASDLGLNTDNFNICLDGRERKDQINKDLQLSQELNVNATPTFVIDGKLYNVTQLEDAIKSYLGPVQ